MTTIAVSKKTMTMAADSRMSMGNLFIDETDKVHNIDGEVLVASAGPSGDCVRFKEWVENGCDLEQQVRWSNDENGIQGLLLYPNKKIFVFWSAQNYMKEIKKDFWAIGSGSDIALGALAAGASPKRAIEIVKTLESGTGGRVKEVGFK